MKPEVIALLSRPVVAALVSINADGSPQLTYVWYEFQGGKIAISIFQNTLKARNVRRDPRITLSVLDPDSVTRYVTLGGNVTISTEGEDDLIRRLSIRYMGETKGMEFYQSVQGPDRLILTMDPTKLYAYGI